VPRPLGSLEPDWRTFTHRDFGNRIGIWRVIEALRTRGLRATVALGAAAAARHPEVVAACSEPGSSSPRTPPTPRASMPPHMAEVEERAAIAAAIAAVEAATGVRPTG
jgi:peptidoglycan/xylan/chitin deacetylase (PgdA/CDA1 family)